MKRISSSLAFVVALLALSVVVGCDYVEAPDPDPIVSPEPLGYVFAGEHDDRLIEWDLSDGAYLFSGEVGWPNAYSHVLDSATLAAFGFYCTNSFSSMSSYVAVQAYTPPADLQLAAQVIVDSSWVCYDLSQDSMQGTIRHYNGRASHDCTGQLYFEYLDSITGIEAYDSAQRIDANLPWRSDGGMFTSYSDYYTGGWSVEESFHRSYPLWSLDPTPHYVAIRLREGDRYRYGYVKISISSSTARLWHIAIER